MVMTIGELATRCWEQIDLGEVTCNECQYRKTCELADNKAGGTLFPVLFDEDYAVLDKIKHIRIDYIG